MAHFLWRTYKITCFQLLHTPYTFIYACGDPWVIKLRRCYVPSLCLFVYICLLCGVFFFLLMLFPLNVPTQAPTPACSHSPTHFTFSFIWLFFSHAPLQVGHNKYVAVNVWLLTDQDDEKILYSETLSHFKTVNGLVLYDALLLNLSTQKLS